MTDEARNECYPSAPTVEFVAAATERAARLVFIDRRNAGIRLNGADRALAAAGGDSIGKGKKA